MKTSVYYFSATGHTKKIAEEIAALISGDSNFTDITSKSADVVVNSDLVIFASPVYSGRIPSVMAERLEKIKGESKAAVIVTFGGRDYDDALLELKNIVKKSGFTVIAAAAFVAEHNLYPVLAHNRPDSDDLSVIKSFATRLMEKVQEPPSEVISIKGDFPYRAIKALTFLAPKGNAECIKCGLCARICPVGAINPDTPKTTDKNRCITCMLCVARCPVKSRHVSPVAKFLTKVALRKYTKRRPEPEIFI